MRIFSFLFLGVHELLHERARVIPDVRSLPRCMVTTSVFFVLLTTFWYQGLRMV